MPYPYPHGTTVYVQRATKVTDPYSGEDEYLTWDTPTETAYDGCAVAPRTSEEPLKGGRIPVHVGLSVYGPIDMDVEPHDRIRIGTDIYEIDGEPARWRSPLTGHAGGTQVDVKKMEG